MFAFATSQSLAAAAPFADVLRFLPSFYLPMVFVAGAGAAAFWKEATGWLVSVRTKRKLRVDRNTLAVAVILAILVPLSAMLLSLAQAGVEQYASRPHSLEAASDYSSFELARSVIGGERVLLVSRAGESEYPPYDFWLEKTAIAYYQDAGSIASEMQRLRLRYVAVGNALHQWGEGDVSAAGLVKELDSDSRFALALSSGTARVYALRGAQAAPDARGENVMAERAELSLDRAEISGECRADACEVLVYSQTMPASAACESELGECSAAYDRDAGAWRVSGVRRGRFSFELAPRHSSIEAALLFAGALLLIVCSLYFDKWSR
jgi:hypothetical protein